MMAAHPVEAEDPSESPPQQGGITIKLVIPAATAGCTASWAMTM
jgi:hypothetical protein